MINHPPIQQMEEHMQSDKKQIDVLLLQAQVIKTQTEKMKEERAKLKEQNKNLLSKFDQIEEKTRCLRVQFLDWLSEQLHEWANAAKAKADQIQTPCAIKLPKKQ